MIKLQGLATETARVNIIPQVRDEVKRPPAQVFLDQEFAFLYMRTMFPYSERSSPFANLSQGNTRLRIGMSKTRKSGNRYGESPSTRDKLSSAFVEALEKDWAEHGSEVIQQIRRDNPVKYGELIARLVPMDANLSDPEGFESCKSMQDIGRRLLQSVGCDEMTDDMIEQAIAANDDFIARLEQIGKLN